MIKDLLPIYSPQTVSKEFVLLAKVKTMRLLKLPISADSPTYSAHMLEKRKSALLPLTADMVPLPPPPPLIPDNCRIALDDLSLQHFRRRSQGKGLLTAFVGP